MAKRRGRWVFVPFEKWEGVLPASFYSLQKSLVASKLFFRNIRPELKDYCIANEVLPPDSLRATWRVEQWIEQHQTAARALVTITEAATEGRGARDIERRRFFDRLARRTPKRTRQDSIRATIPKTAV